jgi:hypothetical protein
MLLRKTAWLVLGVFLFTLSSTGRVAESQTRKQSKKESTKTKHTKEWAVVDGFRSAKFGMDEEEVLQAIIKEFKTTKKMVRRTINFNEKKINLTVTINNILSGTGVCQITYIMGHKSEKLTQVNLYWGTGLGEKTDGNKVILATNLLLSHLSKKRYKKESYVTRAPLNDTQELVFRGRDEKNRLILLVLTTPKKKKGEPQEVSLKLSYILKG